jgi:hypothetical protein
MERKPGKTGRNIFIARSFFESSNNAGYAWGRRILKQSIIPL